MSNPAELALVQKALKLGIGGCVEWNAQVIDRVEAELARHNLSLRAVRNAVIEHVQNDGDVFQIKEEREPWKNRRDYWYKVIVPMPALFPNGLFVDLVLRQLRKPDPEFPEVYLVNAHEQQ